MSKKPNLMLIASGSGTDANAIMNAWREGWLLEVGNIILVSTHAGAKCLEKAKNNQVESFTLIPPSMPLANGHDRHLYERAIAHLAEAHETGLIFLVGCVVVLPNIGSIPMYNIHPADPDLHGGNRMYGLRVHEHVLAAALDEIRRGKKTLDLETIFTYPTVHEVTMVPDDGPPLLRGSVEIPTELLRSVLNEECSLHDAAEKLRDIVLPNEWLMLPTAVRMAATRIFGGQ